MCLRSVSLSLGPLFAAVLVKFPSFAFAVGGGRELGRFVRNLGKVDDLRGRPFARVFGRLGFVFFV
jgi:hypothetical protein